MSALNILKSKSEARATRTPEALIELLQYDPVVLTTAEAVRLKVYLKDNDVRTPYFEDPCEISAYLYQLFNS